MNKREAPARSALVVCLALLATGCATDSSPKVTQTDCPLVTTGADVEEIRRLEEVGAASNVEGWTLEEARAFFAPEWVAVGPDGSAAGVDKVFSQFKDGRNTPRAGAFDLVALDIRVYCDAAIVIGTAEASPIGAPADFKALRFHYLNFWRRSGGRWLYAAQQYSRN